MKIFLWCQLSMILHFLLTDTLMEDQLIWQVIYTYILYSPCGPPYLKTSCETLCTIKYHLTMFASSVQTRNSLPYCKQFSPLQQTRKNFQNLVVAGLQEKMVNKSSSLIESHINIMSYLQHFS